MPAFRSVFDEQRHPRRSVPLCRLPAIVEHRIPGDPEPREASGFVRVAAHRNSALDWSRLEPRRRRSGERRRVAPDPAEWRPCRCQSPRGAMGKRSTVRESQDSQASCRARQAPRFRDDLGELLDRRCVPVPRPRHQPCNRQPERVAGFFELAHLGEVKVTHPGVRLLEPPAAGQH